MSLVCAPLCVVREDASYAKMIEEELRRKEKEQSEEEKAQKLIEERRKRSVLTPHQPCC